MGFFEIAKRLLMGKPVFTTPEQQGRSSVQQSSQQATGVPQAPQIQNMPLPAPQGQTERAVRGPKILPQVVIEHWLCTVEGEGLHCEVFIRNYSTGGVVLDRIEVLGIRDQLGNQLDPGEHYEFHFRLPKRPANANLTECNLYFKDQTGDYFLAKHQVEFEKQQDNTYMIKRFRLIPPIRDV